MQTSSNVYHAFLAQVRERPDSPAMVFPGLTFNYEKLNRLVMAFNKKMIDLGVDSNSTIMVQSSDPLIVVASLLASAHIGASFVQDDEGLILPPELIVTHHFHTVEPERTPAKGSLLIDEKWSPATNLQTGGIPDPTIVANVDRPWLYVYTSGTTGLPKFLALTQRMVFERSMAVADEFVSGKTRVASLTPFNSRTFIARAIAALVNGATIVDGKDLEFWKQAGVTMVTGSVSQMNGFFRTKTLDQRIPIAEVIGSRLSKSDTRELLKHFVKVQDVFGASEANKVFANVSVLGLDNTVVTTGQKRDSTIELVDIDGLPVATGANGILRIRNPYIASGYIGDAKASSDAFRNGWFYSGDIAAWGDNGTLLILDRVDNILNVGGVKINAFIVDQILKSVAGITDAICFKSPKKDTPDELFAFVVFEEGCNQFQVTEIARQQCKAKLGAAFEPRVIRGVAGIPRNESGQPNRKACADLILELGKRKSN